MSPVARLSAALAPIHWGPVDLARKLNINERTVRRWLAGQNEPPPNILAWLEAVAAFHLANPPPERSDE